jgi:hypothetical protein
MFPGCHSEVSIANDPEESRRADELTRSPEGRTLRRTFFPAENPVPGFSPAKRFRFTPGGVAEVIG